MLIYLQRVQEKDTKSVHYILYRLGVLLVCPVFMLIAFNSSMEQFSCYLIP